MDDLAAEVVKVRGDARIERRRRRHYRLSTTVLAVGFSYPQQRITDVDSRQPCQQVARSRLVLIPLREFPIRASARLTLQSVALGSFRAVFDFFAAEDLADTGLAERIGYGDRLIAWKTVVRASTVKPPLFVGRIPVCDKPSRVWAAG